jgi:hypothetical protein
MSSACALVVSLLCFHGKAVSHVESAAVSSNLIVTSKNYVATIWGNDNVYTPDWRTMSAACVEKVCYRYLKHCSVVSGKIQCRYYFGVPGDLEARELQLEASTTRKLRSAEKDIFILGSERSMSSAFSLSAFTIESTTESPAPCPRNEASKCAS